MKLYTIKNWGELFENNRSRELKALNWVVLPNRHDGENYTSIVTHPEGSKIFSAWVLMVQVASKCDPRGALLRGNKTPHTPTSLSVKTRAPIEWFEIAINYIARHTDWLEVKDVEEREPEVVGIASQDGAGIPHDVTKKEGKEGNGKKEVVALVARPAPDVLSDEQFISGLEKSSTYRGIDIRRAYGKMQAWCEVNRKKPSRRRFINWLNREDRPMNGVTSQRASRGPNI